MLDKVNKNFFIWRIKNLGNYKSIGYIWKPLSKLFCGYGEYGAMAEAFREDHAVGDVGPGLEVGGDDGSIFMLGIFIEIDDPLTFEFDGRGAFRPVIAGDGRWGCAITVFQVVADRYVQVLLGDGTHRFIFYEEDIALPVPLDGRIDTVEPRVV